MIKQPIAATRSELVVNEIFDSIQGEGVHTGIAATFVRLQGCNLRCPWCDTKYALGKGGTRMSVEDLVISLSKRMPRTVIWTGGEPLLQWVPMVKVMDELQQAKDFHLETNGTIAPSRILDLYQYFSWITASPKPPAYDLVIQPHEIKIVVTGEEDVMAALKLSKRFDYCPISLQPVDNNPEMVWLCIRTIKQAGMLYAGGVEPAGHRWRLSVQLHKLLDLR